MQLSLGLYRGAPEQRELLRLLLEKNSSPEIWSIDKIISTLSVGGRLFWEGNHEQMRGFVLTQGGVDVVDILLVFVGDEYRRFGIGRRRNLPPITLRPRSRQFCGASEKKKKAERIVSFVKFSILSRSEFGTKDSPLSIFQQPSQPCQSLRIVRLFFQYPS